MSKTVTSTCAAWRDSAFEESLSIRLAIWLHFVHEIAAPISWSPQCSWWGLVLAEMHSAQWVALQHLGLSLREMWFVDCSCMCETQDLLDTVSHSNLLAQCCYGDGYHSNRLFVFVYWDVWVYWELVSELTSTDTTATKKKGVGNLIIQSQWDQGRLNNGWVS